MTSRSNNVQDKAKMLKFLNGIEPSQIEDMKSIFQALDIDQNGVITQNELVTGMKKAHVNATEEDVKNLFESLDLNEDGKIDFEEFISGMRWLNKGLNISTKLAPSPQLSDDKKKIKKLQIKNDFLVKYLRDVIQRGIIEASKNYKKEDYDVAQAVLDTIDWDLLTVVEDVVGRPLTTPKQTQHQKIMRKGLINNTTTTTTTTVVGKGKKHN
eukprot:TRINITY_DN1491_c1_g3_i1.p1 TRINITY_DN1491_c1_g3~~TRINITY_DN1491_c1_g3_i1.p1  ORF type:complete len:212 (-),score=56.91 TRINITY_DN1491_c1_g3_i1:72-707(-)